MDIFDVAALKAERDAIQQAKRNSEKYATQAVNEFCSAAQQVGTPGWRPPDAIAKDIRRDKFNQGWLILRDSKHSEWWMTAVFGAIAEHNGNHRLHNLRASAAEVGKWIAAVCGYDIESMKRVFHEALVDVPLSSAQV